MIGAGPGDITLDCRGVLFDCDGVLVDSEASVVAAWTQWAAEFGLDAAAVLAVVHGRRSADTVAALVAVADRPRAQQLIDSLELASARTVRGIAGAAALLAAVPPDRWAVVTSGTRALARARLAAAGLPEPRVLITADDVRHGKPDPEGYAAAAAGLGVDPTEAVVLEDALAGIEAGRAAGVEVVVGVGGRSLERAADLVVGDLRTMRWREAGLVIRYGCLV